MGQGSSVRIVVSRFARVGSATCALIAFLCLALAAGFAPAQPAGAVSSNPSSNDGGTPLTSSGATLANVPAALRARD